MRIGSTFLVALTSMAAGWYLHAYLGVSSDPVNSPARRVVPETVDLRGYYSQLPSGENNPEKTGANPLQSYLNAKNFNDALAYYNQLPGSASNQESQQLRLAILEFAYSLKQENSVDDALTLLNLYLEQNYRDVDALQLKASILADKKDYRQQIEVLYESKAYAYQERDIKKIVNNIRFSVDRYKQILLEHQTHSELLNLFQTLVYQEPDYSPYFIELAKAQIKNNLEYDAKQSLELVTGDPVVGVQARQLLSEFRQHGEGDDGSVALIDDSQTIPLLRRGDHFIVEAIINRNTRLNLIIDTGASLTVIKPESIRHVVNGHWDRYPAHLFNTANGVVKAPVLNIDSLAIGEFEVSDLQVGGLALINSAGIDGLLGMNFLKHFRFFIDQENNLLRLSLSD
ncbi:retroviral-like aspartic protease family protein, partial [Kaarinaea lacus]